MCDNAANKNSDSGSDFFLETSSDSTACINVISAEQRIRSDLNSLVSIEIIMACILALICILGTIAVLKRNKVMFELSKIIKKSLLLIAGTFFITVILTTIIAVISYMQDKSNNFLNISDKVLIAHALDASYGISILLSVPIFITCFYFFIYKKERS